MVNPYQTPATLDESAVAYGETGLDLNRVWKGLRWVHRGIVLIVGSFAVCILGSMLLAFLGVSIASYLFSAVLVIGTLAGMVSIVSGQVHCAGAPAESTARSPAVASLVCQVVALVALALSVVVTVGPFSMSVGLNTVSLFGLTNLLVALCWIGSTFCFLAFLKRLNRFVGNRSLVRSANVLLVMLITLIVIYIGGGTALTIYVAQNRAGQFGFPYALFGFAILLLGLITFVKFANLIQSTAKSLAPKRIDADAPPSSTGEAESANDLS